MVLDPELESAALAVLARAPAVPRDISLFTSNALFGEPGIYPDGTPMEPASGSPLDDDAVHGQLEHVLFATCDRGPAADEAMRRFESRELSDAVPNAAIRSGLVALTGTLGRPILDAFPNDTTAMHLDWGAPGSLGRVIGPTANGDPQSRVVNERYRCEHPALLAPSLAHDLLWTPATTGHAAETILHALAAMIHLQLIARVPTIAHMKTELARRQNSLAITLLNSRQPGSARISLIAPDGPGTIPGGAQSMQTPDFWSVPFAPKKDTDAPAIFSAVLDGLVERDASETTRPYPVRFDETLGRWLSSRLRDEWLSTVDRIRAAVTLGLVSASDFANEAGLGVTEAIAAFGIENAVAAWD